MNGSTDYTIESMETKYTPCQLDTERGKGYIKTSSYNRGYVKVTITDAAAIEYSVKYGIAEVNMKDSPTDVGREYYLIIDDILVTPKAE